MKIETRDTLVRRILFMMVRTDSRIRRCDLQALGNSLMEIYRDLKGPEIEKRLDELDEESRYAQTKY